jgi:hypothetical protein
MMEATISSETSVYNQPARRHVPADGILRSNRREDLQSYGKRDLGKPPIRHKSVIRVEFSCDAQRFLVS